MFGKFEHITGAARVRLHRRIMACSKRADVSFILPELAVGGVCKIKYLHSCGIKSIVDMRLENTDDKYELEKYSMNYLNVKVLDRGIPTLEEAKDATTWIKKEINAKRNVFIHCNLGRGRGPLIAILYLISQDMVMNDVIVKIKKLRPYTYLNENQLKFIKKFSENY
ncbi:MAG: dual specificity protein phosphatase family protein [Candidatus Nitrosoabyssus spongiisocia]|nr:MAG: dual specificity protein phosphatase family protein [Nitrosopumilaceae archaeon AB1(1)]